jgi:hypothetical protein
MTIDAYYVCPRCKRGYPTIPASFCIKIQCGVCGEIFDKKDHLFRRAKK